MQINNSYLEEVMGKLIEKLDPKVRTMVVEFLCHEVAFAALSFEEGELPYELERGRKLLWGFLFKDDIEPVIKLLFNESCSDLSSTEQTYYLRGLADELKKALKASKEDLLI